MASRSNSLCFVDRKHPATFVVKFRKAPGIGFAKQKRPLCDEHAAQARAAKYNVQPLEPQREEEE